MRLEEEVQSTNNPFNSVHVCVLKDYTTHFPFLSLIYSIFIHVTLLTIISKKIKPYFRLPDILQNLLIFQNQIFK
ncbi:hypothetical protein LDENG_00267050 [Lucifuga dentata]|nr:hypothetical protein LDENG_00267050 [Lucifuga dentata]